MKKSIFYFVGLLCIAIIAVQCESDGDSTKLSKVTGTVSVGGDAADGAIVTLSDAPNAANVIAVTVSDETGKYTFINIEEGTYYLNAKLDPGNTNGLMLKSTKTVVLTGVEVEVDVSGNETAQDIAMAGAAPTGTGTISLSGGSAWDNTHSTIGFEFPYDAFNAAFKGHFSNAGVDVIEFDESDPTSMVVKAWVDLTSVETGAPSGFCGHGRDGITGCIQGTYQVELDAADTVTVYCEDGSEHTSFPNTAGVDYDLWGDGSTTTYQKPSAVIGATGVATFEITGVTAFGTGYMATADFTFAGSTQSVDFYFTYLEGFQAENRSGVQTNYNSIYGWFKFQPSAIGVNSSHVGDAMVTVKISAQFNNPV